MDQPSAANAEKPERAHEQTRRARRLLVAALAALAAFALSHTAPFAPLKRLTADQMFRLRRPPRPSDRIVHVDIDDGSISKIGRWPWRRKRMAQLLEALSALGVRRVVLDVELPQPSPKVVETQVLERFEKELPARLAELAGSNEAAPASGPAPSARQLEGLQRLISAGIDSFITDDDELLAAAMKRCGNLFMAYSLRTDDPLTGAEKKAVEILKGDFRSGRDELLRGLGLPSTSVLRYERVKGQAAFELLMEASSRAPGGSMPPQVLRLAADDEDRALLARSWDAAQSCRAVTAGQSAQGLPAALDQRPPLALFARSVAACGFSNAEVDADGVLRRIPLAMDYRGLHLHLGLRSVLAGPVKSIRRTSDGICEIECAPESPASIPSSQTRPADGSLRSLRLPVDRGFRLAINWHLNDASKWTSAYTHLPAAAFIDYAEALEHQRSLDSARERLLDYADEDLFSGRFGRAKLRAAVEAAQGADAAPPRQRLAAVDREMLTSPLWQAAAQPPAVDDPPQLKAIRQYKNLLAALQADAERARKNRSDAQMVLLPRLRGRLAIVGATFTGSTDFRNTPVGTMPAVMLYSSVIDSLLDGETIKLPKAAYDVALFVVIAALVCLAVSFGNTVVAGVCAALLLAGAFAASYLGFAHFSRMVDPVGAMTGVVCVFAATISYREIFEGRQRRMLHNIFRHFTHPAVIKNMMQHPDKIRLGGEQKRLTILFSDVKNFSTISEQLDPEALTRLLNRYLGAMTDAVLENFGTLDKYLGDGIMAFWGAPVDNPAHANLAALAALNCVERAGRLNAELENEGIAPLTTRIGINTGEVVVGNMGSRDRFDYTVLGDAANLASRLEGVNKIFGTTILLGEATRAELPPGEFVLREIDVVRVKGRSEPARIYELVGLAEKTPDEALGRLADFAEALTLYRAGKWREAQAAFELLAAQDQPSAVYAERSAALAANPPGDDWDGVFQMTVK